MGDGLWGLFRVFFFRPICGLVLAVLAMGCVFIIPRD